jgi:hypothetical protein
MNANVRTKKTPKLKRAVQTELRKKRTCTHPQMANTLGTR